MKNGFLTMPFAILFFCVNAMAAWSGNVLAISSAAGDSGLDGSMFAGQTVDYSSQNDNAPVVYTAQSLSPDGTIQIAFGVAYQDGGFTDKNENKIRITLYPDAIFNGPDSYGWTDSSLPDFAHASTEQMVQFLVLSWNKNTPAALSMRGISDSNSNGDQFVTAYSAEKAQQTH